MSPLRIGQVIATEGPGGAERVFAELAGSLKALGHDVVAFVPVRRAGWLHERLYEAGVAVETFRDEAGRVEDGRLLRSFRARKLELIHAHMITAIIHAAQATRSCGIPQVATLHGADYRYAGFTGRRALRRALGSCRRVVAVAACQRAELARDLRFRGTVDVVPNGTSFEPAVSSPLRAELGLAQATPLIACVGNLYPVKGHRHLLEAVGRLTRDDVHVAIAGRGEEESALREQAGVLGIAERVHLLGLQIDVAGVLASADVFVHPSLEEGLPLAVLEAMFAARPIVATDVGDVRVALADGACGVVVPPGDAGALACAVERLLEDPDRARALGRVAAERARVEYRLDTMVDRYAAIYDEVLAG